jgi:hypothetical protein
MMPDIQSIARALGGRRAGGASWLCHCPVPTHGKGRGDRNPSLSIRLSNDRLIVNCFTGCDFRDVIAELQRRGFADDRHDRPPPSLRHSQGGIGEAATDLVAAAYDKRQHAKALVMWRARLPAANSPVETYLREFRHYNGPLPATIGYLPPCRPEHHPAMIAAFGLADEPEPGILAIADKAVRGVQLTLLRPDGRGKALVGGRVKISIGQSTGYPMVVAPMNDLLGLTVTEGIEDALSLFAASGTGAWAAGGCSRFAALAPIIPTYVDQVNVASDPDAGGRRGGVALVRELRKRGVFAVPLFGTEADYPEAA